MKKILFVCTGNICRSSTAEALLKQRLSSEGYFSDSAGTHGYHVGEPSDHRAIKTASKRGVDMSDIRARKLEAEDMEEFDYIFAMDQGHLKILHNIATEPQKQKISLFLDHSDQGIKDVPDPYYGDMEGFEKTFDILEAGLDGIISFIKK